MADKAQAHMDRIRATRGLPPQTRENLMDRTAAALCYVGTARTPEHQRKLEIHAFMDIFHPEMSHERVREMVNG